MTNTATENLKSDWRQLRDQGINMSLETLPKMLLADKGPFCMELAKDGRPAVFDQKHSWRYTLMCLLGLERAQQSGRSTTINISAIFDHALKTSPSFKIGDIGLLLWLAVRLKSDRIRAIADDLESRLSSCDLDQLEGMEVGWLLTGLSSAIPSGVDAALAKKVLDYLLTKRVGESGLIRHYGVGLRSRFPNFATQIYSLLSLSIAARHIKDSRIAPCATKLANLLIKAQRSNGGWPWLYDAKSGDVVEPFEVYSVHQHAMAPMGFLEYMESFGHDVSAAIIKGLKWIDSNNELNYNMVDGRTGLIYRSVMRKYPASRIVPYTRVAKRCLGLAVPGEIKEDVRGLELNATCRPYELGWLLEAWCARDTVSFATQPVRG